MDGGFGARFLRFRGAERRRRPHEKPRVPLVGEVGERPVEHDEEAIAEADEEEDVDAQPGQPGGRAQSWKRPKSATPARRPMVASEPLST